MSRLPSELLCDILRRLPACSKPSCKHTKCKFLPVALVNRQFNDAASQLIYQHIHFEFGFRPPRRDVLVTQKTVQLIKSLEQTEHGRSIRSITFDVSNPAVANDKKAVILRMHGLAGALRFAWPRLIILKEPDHPVAASSDQFATLLGLIDGRWVEHVITGSTPLGRVLWKAIAAFPSLKRLNVVGAELPAQGANNPTFSLESLHQGYHFSDVATLSSMDGKTTHRMLSRSLKSLNSLSIAPVESTISLLGAFSRLKFLRLYLIDELDTQLGAKCLDKFASSLTMLRQLEDLIITTSCAENGFGQFSLNSGDVFTVGETIRLFEKLPDSVQTISMDEAFWQEETREKIEMRVERLQAQGRLPNLRQLDLCF